MIGTFRIEHDALGPVQVPAERLYGAQSVRAQNNFPLSRQTIAAMPALIVALAQVKKAATLTNIEIGELDGPIARAILVACDELIAGRWHTEFIVDVYQGGAGTSTNMNMNEVLANRALVLLGLPPGQYETINPNDHANRSQSTNDAYASAVRLTVHALNAGLIGALERLQAAFERKASQFAGVRKLGRTQLQDAVPMTLGQEFGAYAATIGEDAARGEEIGRLFLEVNLGGTAIGTGVGASPAYADRIVSALRETTGLEVVRAANLIEATWDMGGFVFYSGFLKRVAAKLSKIANDLRLLGSGPRGGFAELRLPERQAGSSIMPGKVNPVIPEAMNQIAFKVFGADTTITFAAEAGQLQLNAFEPVILWSLQEATDLLVNGVDMLIVNCIDGLEANLEGCRDNLVRSTALATALAPHLGYETAATLARMALSEGIDLRDAVMMAHPDALALYDSLAAEAPEISQTA